VAALYPSCVVGIPYNAWPLFWIHRCRALHGPGDGYARGGPGRSHFEQRSGDERML